MSRKSLIALLGAAALIGGTVVGVAASDDDPSRQEVVAERSARVMPFPLDATTHVSKPPPTAERSA